MRINVKHPLTQVLLISTTLLFSSGSWALSTVEAQKIQADDGALVDGFGHSLAISGDTAVIGSPRDDDNGSSSGSAYVFIRTGTTWSQQAKLTASDGNEDYEFGWSVDISGDTVVIGSYRDGANGFNSGSAYVFTRAGTTWSQQSKLTPSDIAFADQFGWAVAVSGDTAVISSLLDDDNSDNSGSVYVFTRSGTTWSQQAKVNAASDAELFGAFGWSVTINGDTAVIGSREDSTANGPGSGSAYVFTRAGTTWSQQANLTASDGAGNDGFGASVAISGETAVIGSYRDDDNGSSSGSAYVFTRAGITWTEEAKLIPSDGNESDEFGTSVAISGDTAVVGSPLYEDSGFVNTTGAAYSFARTGTTWSQQAKLTAGDPADDSRFGISVAIIGDTAVIGRNEQERFELSASAGSAYSFSLSCASSTYALPHGQWRMISIPCALPANVNTVAAVFGDDNLGVQNTDWAMFSYNPTSKDYTSLTANSVLEQGRGYWVIQVGANAERTLSLPASSVPSTVNTDKSEAVCNSTKGCLSTAIATAASSELFLLFGNPFASQLPVNDIRVITNASTGPTDCSLAVGCTLTQADGSGILLSLLYSYDGNDYNIIRAGNNLQAWDGFWAASKSNANGTTPVLMLPQP